MQQEDLFGDIHAPAQRGKQGDLFELGGISAESVIAAQRDRIDAARLDMERERCAAQLSGQGDIVHTVAELEGEHAAGEQ